MTPRALLAGGLLVLASCYFKPDPEPRAPTCEEKPDPHCANAIDHVVIPKLRSVHLEPRDGDAATVCRRLAIDLIGRIPTSEELDRCRAQTLDARVDTFMAMPEYVLEQQRTWAEIFGFDTDLVWYGYAADLDALVARFARGEVPYAAFATQVVVHPGFYALHQGDDWPAHVIDNFLGRSARPDEIAGMRPLSRIFEERVFCDAAIWTTAYQDAVEDGIAPAEAEKEANDACVGSGSEEFGYNFCSCQEGYGSIGCRSTTLGRPIDLGTDGCRDPEAQDPTQYLYRLASVAPGSRASCADGATRRECHDKIVDENEQVQGALGSLPAIDPALQQRLFAIGDALAARDDFWEAAVDRELRRFIGWWKDGIRRPDFDLPEVRTVLARMLRTSGDLRAIQKLIVTSLLYQAPSEPPVGLKKGVEPPLWSMGSTKMLTAENWLDSAGVATVGTLLGYCDFRFLGIGELGPTNTDPELVKHIPSPLGDEVFPETRYLSDAQQLGGCSADMARPRVSTVGMTYAQHDVARTLCAHAPAVLPPGFRNDDVSDAALGGAAAHLVRRALSRDATAEEVTALGGEMKECLAAGAATGCESAEAAVRWLCVRIVDSAEFALY
jgi:hypothetical protein